MTKTFSGNDILLVIASTVIIGLLLIAVSSYYGHTDSLLFGLGGLISVLLVRVRVMGREMAQLKLQLRERQTNESAQTA